MFLFDIQQRIEYLCDSYGIKRKPTTVKNPRANGILECKHHVLGQMLHTADIAMADSVTPNDVDVFLDNAAWTICSTYPKVIKASPGVAVFGRDMLFNILFVADWHKIGKQMQSLTNCGSQHKNGKHIYYDYKAVDKVLLINEGILRKAEFAYSKEPWIITTVHTNGTIRIHCGIRMERLCIWRVQPFLDDIL